MNNFEIANNSAVDTVSIASVSEISVISEFENSPVGNFVNNLTEHRASQSGNIVPGNVSVAVAEKVSVGDKIIYQGPVTIHQYVNSENKILSWVKRRKYPLILLSSAAVLIVVGVIMFIELYSPFDPADPVIPSNGTFRFVSRSEWAAHTPVKKMDLFKLPVKNYIIGHTVTPNCDTLRACSERVRSIQEYHLRKGWADIGYNFLVGGDGRGYEGRGFKKVGAHTHNFNRNSIFISFIGNFENETPSEAQLNAAKEIIAFGVANNFVTPDYKLYGQKQLNGAESPGQTLFEIIIKWPHWSAEVIRD